MAVVCRRRPLSHVTGSTAVDCLELLDLRSATVVVNNTAGGLFLLALASGHPGLARVDGLVLTNCDNYDQFPPDALRKATALCRTFPRLARVLIRLRFRSSIARRRGIAIVAAGELDHGRAESFFGPIQRDRRVADDFVAASAGCRPQLLIDAADAIPRFDRPVLLIWGDACDFFPTADAQRLASAFPRATLVTIPGAKTWVPIENPTAVADAITQWLPNQPRNDDPAARTR